MGYGKPLNVTPPETTTGPSWPASEYECFVIGNVNVSKLNKDTLRALNAEMSVQGKKESRKVYEQKNFSVIDGGTLKVYANDEEYRSGLGAEGLELPLEVLVKEELDMLDYFEEIPRKM